MTTNEITKYPQIAETSKASDLALAAACVLADPRACEPDERPLFEAVQRAAESADQSEESRRKGWTWTHISRTLAPVAGGLHGATVLANEALYRANESLERLREELAEQE
jgi:hypothetical protein